jgi:hypothetical protein
MAIAAIRGRIIGLCISPPVQVQTAITAVVSCDLLKVRMSKVSRWNVVDAIVRGVRVVFNVCVVWIARLLCAVVLCLIRTSALLRTSAFISACEHLVARPVASGRCAGILAAQDNDLYQPQVVEHRLWQMHAALLFD